ncbi:hypothetical protein ACKKBG_A16865 [Auxenochlorella protothecoides x Auxenochlorella symbiontica]
MTSCTARAACSERPSIGRPTPQPRLVVSREVQHRCLGGGVVAAGAAPPARSVALLLLQTVAPPLLLVEGLTVLPAEGLQLAEALLAGAPAPAETRAALLTRPPLLLAGGWALLPKGP